jgi:hypothetical protein
MSEGTNAIMEFNWNGVERFIQPQLQLIFLRDKFSRPEDQTFMKFPFAVVIARNAQVVELDSVFELDLEESDASAGEKKVHDALLTLESKAQSLGGKRMEDTVRMVRALSRALRTE